MVADGIKLDRLAGSDTTAISLRSVFYYSLKTPGVLAKLRQELETAERDGAISPSITLAEGLRLPYLYVQTPKNLFMAGPLLTDLFVGKLLSKKQ
jgi:cytochrome P450